MKFRMLLVCIPIIFLLASCTIQPKELPTALNGELILTQEDFMNNDMIPLNGEWEFYWKELLTESEIKKRLQENPNANITIPSGWENTVGTPFGYGTYYLKVIIPEEKIGNTLAITTTNQSTSYTLLVNEVRVASNGYVGSSIQTSEPEYSNRLVYFTPRDKELNIVLHVSNFVDPIGGASKPIYIGTAQQVTKGYDISLASTMFIIGSILVMGILELFIYFFRRKEKVSFYFGLISIFISLYSISKPPYYFNKIFSSVPWIWEQRFEIICIYMLFILYLILIRTIYPKETKRLPIVVGIIISIAASMTTLFTDPVFYRPLLNYVFVVIMLFIIYFLYVLILAYARKRPTALVNLIANIIFFGSVLNDVLLSQGWIHSIPFATIGFFLYVLIQSINLSRDYARKFDEAEKLSIDLQKLNASLDEKIKESTQELKIKNAELKRLTQTDGLTGIYNRRYFDKYLGKRFEEALKTGIPLSMLMIDIDDFKKYNDTNGHVAGDELIMNFSQLVKEECQAKGFIARYGGEEFGIVLPNMSLDSAVQFAENVRLIVEQLKYPTKFDSTYVTVSIGVSSTENYAFTQKEELIERADQALYKSKANGKNQVTFL